MADAPRVLRLVKERYRIERRLLEINKELGEELGDLPSRVSIHRLAFESLLDGDMGIGTIVRHVMENGGGGSDERDTTAAVTRALSQLKSVQAIEYDTEVRLYQANDMTTDEVMERLHDRFRPETSEETPPVKVRSSPTRRIRRSGH